MHPINNSSHKVNCMLHYRLSKNQVMNIIKSANELKLSTDVMILLILYSQKGKVNLYNKWDYQLCTKKTLWIKIKRLVRIGLITHSGKRYYLTNTQKRTVLSLFTFLQSIQLNSMPQYDY